MLYIWLCVLPYLDKAGSTERIVLIDFSSAFNTIQPSLLRGKLLKMQVGTSTTPMIIDYLTDRPVCVTEGTCVWAGG